MANHSNISRFPDPVDPVDPGAIPETFVAVVTFTSIAPAMWRAPDGEEAIEALFLKELQLVLAPFEIEVMDIEALGNPTGALQTVLKDLNL